MPSRWPLSLHQRGLFSWTEWAAALAAQIGRAQAQGDADLGDTYYRHWLAALESLVAAQGRELRRRNSAATATPGTMPPTARRTASRSSCSRATSTA